MVMKMAKSAILEGLTRGALLSQHAKRNVSTYKYAVGKNTNKKERQAMILLSQLDSGNHSKQK